jgi:hypothetical protein
MKQETLQKLIEEYTVTNHGVEDLAQFLSSTIEQERVLAKRLATCRQQAKSERAQHKEEMERIHQILEDIQAECPHHETTYCGDPSGGSDKSETCNLCGKELR